MVYTVHNLALQGIRPFHNDESSLEHWFPSLSYDGQVICDPRYFHCLNPMRAAINLADKVHLVSPTYALEVLHTSEHENGFFGGEGLERDLKQAQEQNKLSGILNGCDYDDETVASITLSALLNQSKQAVKAWMAQSSELKTVHYLASEQIKNWLKKSDFKGPLVTSIGRLTDQKVLLLRKKMNDTDVFSDLLQSLANAGGKMILLGSGDVQIEFEFMQLMAKHDNFLFLNGYDQALSEYLYHLGDLFLMPSSFEPCGISQMLALKAGQPCLVHSVGGLKDTVKHLENGFCFDGESITEQQYNLIHVLKVALDVFNNQEDKWCKLTKQAKEERFSWHRSANLYVSELYQHRK
jgi:starch synthase